MRPVMMFGTSPAAVSAVSGKDVRIAIKFDLDESKTLRAAVGISGVSTEGAKRNLDAEIKDWNFEKLHQQARAAWNQELSRIDITGGTKDQQTVFYTALYHTFLVPNVYQDVDGSFRGTDSKIHKAQGF